MSQTSKALKKIAATEEYKTLAAAIEAADYAAIAAAYAKVGEVIEAEKKQILDQILALPRQNRGEDVAKFQTAFAQRAGSELPKWQWLSSQLEEQGVMTGEVIGAGSKGDPMVRTAAGRMVIISGAALEKGAKVRFKVTTPGPNLDFGRPFELTPDNLRFILNRDALAGLKKAFDGPEERLRGRPITPDEGGLGEISELLKGLESARELAGKMDKTDADATVARVNIYRKRLLNDFVVKMAFGFLSQEEAREITELGADRAVLALAPGLFRWPEHQALKARLFAGEGLKGLAELASSMEARVDSMAAALENMEFKAKLEKLEPAARSYLERIDRLFQRLDRKARQLALAMGEDRIFSAEDINSRIRGAFSGDSLGVELRQSFRDTEEFFSMRGALADLMALLGDSGIMAAETALRPYLARKISAAFESARPRRGA